MIDPSQCIYRSPQRGDYPQKKSAVRPFGGSCVGATSALGLGTETVFVVDDGTSDALDFSCFF